MRIQIIAIAGSIGFMLFVFELIRRKKLKEAYAMIWLIMGAFFMLLAFWQQGLGIVSNLCGIYYAPAFLFLVLLVTLTIILIQFSIVISRQADKIKALGQESALMKEQLNKLTAAQLDKEPKSHKNR